MKNFDVTTIKLKTKTLLTFENKTVKKSAGIETDPTTTMFPTGTGFPMAVIANGLKRN